jgi:hypothetical protein
MNPAAAGFMQALQDSSFAAAIRGGTLVYPFVNVAHVLGVALLVGAIVALDARVLGFVRQVPAEAASRLLTPFAVAGLVLAVPSGLALFVSDAVSLSRNALFLSKLALIALGVANAVLFRHWWNARLSHWDRDPPAAGRVQAVLSIAIWIVALSLGRLIAYI